MPDPSESILIPVGDPERAPRYVDLGARIAKKLGSELVLLTIELAELNDKQAVTEEKGGRPSEGLRNAKAYAEDLDVPARLLQIRARDVAEGIVAAAQDPAINYLIMGWRGDVEGGSSAIGERIDGLVREANAHTIVMQESPLKEDERVLLPVLSMSLAPLSLAIASILAGSSATPITVLHFSPGELPGEEEEQFRSSLFTFEEARKGSPLSFIRKEEAFEERFEVTDDPVKHLLTVAEEYDHLILEASQAQALQEKVHDAFSHTNLAEATPCPLILVRPKNQDVKFGL